MKRLVVNMNDGLHKNIKIQAAKEGIPLRSLIIRLIVKYLQARKYHASQKDT